MSHAGIWGFLRLKFTRSQFFTIPIQTQIRNVFIIIDKILAVPKPMYPM